MLQHFCKIVFKRFQYLSICLKDRQTKRLAQPMFQITYTSMMKRIIPSAKCIHVIISALENEQHVVILCVLSVSYPPNRYIATQLLGDQGDTCDADRPNDAEFYRLLYQYLCIVGWARRPKLSNPGRSFGGSPWQHHMKKYEEVFHSRDMFGTSACNC